ncbi:hypothetical protein [Streptomyces xinghaiensis]|uniref:hypothetical protein n=1 Tax=Streptomyces xinghaiensis TaxID=1038928 RepID=UPI00186460C8|nr:hypothetical protein [Streptomyces xinghaiensis]
MSKLMRAPRECGSWNWDLEEVASPGLESALATAGRMAEVLTRYDMLLPHKIEIDWYVAGRGGIGVTTTLALTCPLEDPLLAERARASRPTGFPDAEIAEICVIGSGVWIDEDGRSHREPRLVELSVDPAPVGLSAEMAVHHDIWGWFDFAGRPHPEIQKRNAPRMEAALRELNALLGVAAEPGEMTYFGFATEFGIGTPDALEDGTGPDVTDKL